MSHDNDRSADGPGEWSSVVARFTANAHRCPERVAVECGEAFLTYEEMSARVERFAGRLAGRLADANRVVGVCLDRNVDLPGWLMAVLRVGGAYFPLDPTLPAARLASMIDDAEPALIVASRGLAATLPATDVSVIIAEDEEAVDPAPPCALRPGTLAYIIYTSGSTGRPKGVEIEHGSLAALMTTMAASPGFAAGQRMLGLTRISFDLSVPDMFLPFAVGGTLALVDLETAADPARLAAAFARHQPDLAQATPSTWRTLLEWGWEGAPGLRVLAGGEAMTRELADRLLTRSGDLWNIYGPTEATVWATATRVRAGDGPVPIGWPLTGMAASVLDDRLQPLPPGQTGEIVIGGSGVARGYRNRPELNAERFVRLDDGRRVYRTGDLGRFDEQGALFCLGRSDDQVKLRGFRIELGDVEAAMSAHPAVAWSAARLLSDTAGEPVLVGYIVPRQGVVPSTAAIRTALEGLLPRYMIPDRLVTISAMPLTPNGKVDRAALPNPFANAAPAPTARSDAAADRLAVIWCDLLGVTEVARDDDFFALGGYSLMTVRLVRRIEAAFGVKLALLDLMRSSTLAAMAERIERGATDPGGEDAGCMPLNTGGEGTPLYWLDAGPIMRAMLRDLDAGQPAFSLNLSPDDEDALASEPLAVSAVAERLRHRLLAFQPNGRFHIGGWCRWGIVAFELAQQLAREGRPAGWLVLLDADRPRAHPRVAVRRRVSALFRGPARAIEPASFSQRVEGAAARYRPASYDGQTLLVRPRDATGDGDGGWGALIGEQLTVRCTVGDHESMVRPPHARGVSEAISQSLWLPDLGSPQLRQGLPTTMLRAETRK